MDGGRGNRAGGRGIRVESSLKQNNKKNKEREREKAEKEISEETSRSEGPEHGVAVSTEGNRSKYY